jgi:hypothetical protein
MSNSEFENYLALIGKLLQLTRQQRESIGTELRDHLESRVADLMDLGLDHSLAVQQALEEFGDAALMAKNLQFVSQLNRRRWMMRFATFSIVGCFLAAVLTMALWPENPRFGAPDQSMADVQDQDDKALAAANKESPFEGVKDPFGAAGSGAPGSPQVSPKHHPTVFEINDQLEKSLLELVDLTYEEVEWGEIRRDLHARFNLNIITDPIASDIGLSDEELVSVQLRGLPLEICLKHLLKPKECTFIVKDGALIVIPLENAEDPEFLSIRFFDCRELIKRLDLSRSSNKAIMLDQSGGMGGMGGGMGGGMFFIQQPRSGASPNANIPIEPASQPNLSPQVSVGVNQARTSLRSIATPEDLLSHLVTSMVGDEDKWSDPVKDQRGTGNLKVVNGYLVVRHTRAVLSEVEVFLNMLDKNLRADELNPVN